jgi:competence protein ComFC
MSHHSECYDCKRWKKLEIGDALTSNYSIYHYTTSIKELIAKWKYRGDYILGEIFRSDMKAAFHSLQFKKDITIVPIPLSKERLQERAFNQAEMLASFLPAQTVLALKRTNGEKQSKKDRQARLNAPNPFIVMREMKKPVLLIDDIYTTGTTLRHAAYSLKQQGCPAVYSLTLIRG